jgi:hypothetical protein
MLKGYLEQIKTDTFQTKLKREIDKCLELSMKKSAKLAKKQQVMVKIENEQAVKSRSLNRKRVPAIKNQDSSNSEDEIPEMLASKSYEIPPSQQT